ncbi:hypothetical protein GGI22_004706, partial [Coemansia erecta]
QVDYGLTSAEILLADEKLLNEYFSVKKIATYRPEERIENDLSLYAKGSRMKYIKKKAQASRAEWIERLANIPEKSNGKKRRAKAESSSVEKSNADKNRSAKKPKKETKVEKAKASVNDAVVEKVQPGSVPVQETSKSLPTDDVAAAAAKIKKLNRRQRQKANKSGLATESKA